MELAPAVKQSAWASLDISVRPALNLTIARGMSTLAVATIRVMARPDTGSAFSSGVPATLISALMATNLLSLASLFVLSRILMGY